MNKLFLLLTFLNLLFVDKYPADITGKWVVDSVSGGNMEQVAPPEIFAAINESLLKPLKNATFDFRADHTFDLSATLGKMPKGKFWGYNAENGVITIRENEDPKSVVMVINILEKDGVVIFHLAQTAVTAKVHKKQE